VYILVVFIYLNFSDVLEIAFGIPDANKVLVAIVAISILGSRAVIRNQPLHFRRTEIMIAVYFLVSTSSIFFSGGTDGIISEFVDTAKDLMILIIIVQISDEEEAFNKMQWLLILSAAFLSALTVYQMLSGDVSNNFYGFANAPVHQITDGFDSTRPTGPLEDPNFYSQILLMVVPLAVYRAIGETSFNKKMVALVCLVLIIAAIIFTYSRSSLVMMLIVGFLIIRERRLNVYKIAGLAVLVYIMFIPILPAGYSERLFTITDIFQSSEQQTERSFIGRTSEMIVAVQMFQDNPLFGVGYTSYEDNYLDYSTKLGLDDRLESREAHSLYLEMAAETGLIGIIAFGSMILTIFLMMHKSRKQLIEIQRPDLIPWLIGLQYGLMAYLFTSLFLHDGYVRYFRLIIGLSAGSIALVDSLVKKHHERGPEVVD
jgi:putative inorganic carbon (hco3(-)) transporter